MFSLQISEPGSLARWKPVCCPACQMPNTAPAGSAATAIRPASMTSNGSLISLPPAAVTFSAVASAFSVARYVVQAVGVPGGPIFGPIPATIWPSISHIE